MSSSRPNRNAARRGTVPKLGSCMEVTIWVRLMRMPTMKPIVWMGRHSQNVVISTPRNRSITVAVLIALIEALHQGAHHQIPAIDKHEQENLERGGYHDRR